MRRFSSCACWLLSSFTVGISTNGRCSASTSTSVGTVPPIMRMRTGSLAGLGAVGDFSAANAQRPTAASIGVRSAACTEPSRKLASLS